MRNLTQRLPIRGRGYSLASYACGPLACNLYALVCDSTRDAVVVDPSCGTAREFRALEAFLEKHEATPKHILLTHGHPDHLLGVSLAMDAWPEASLHLHPLEEPNYNDARRMGADLGLRFVDDRPLPEPTHSLADGDVVRVGDSIELAVVHTPGHSPGHVALVDRRGLADSATAATDAATDTATDSATDAATANNGDDSESRDMRTNNNTGNVLISGDLLFHGSVGRTDFHNSSMDDLYASLRRLYELFDDDSIVLSGHTTPTFLKKERTSNPFVDLALRRPLEWYEEARDWHGWNDQSLKAKPAA
eukprot:CAMPEP_0172388098 /NCGR_PEP_ID=MMETSP1061-20121228/5263_1 /TAXON_ID=37318 /ORGANISM="Pseudo-nitzschia pungens, Strain cf. pungens" /LENGTH=305 /DNA_ID=CAMNT_0013117909 /DNA_START=156 /DNA_END=1073 /DNA_ORIENTATION=-